MVMSSRLRKVALTAHVTSSVGWLGAVVAYLGVALSGLFSKDVQLARADYLVMELVGWCIIVPFSIAALATGLLESFVTPWGLFRYHWVQAKLLLTTCATIVLFLHLSTVSRMSGIATATAWSTADSVALRIQLVVHAVGGLLLLVAATVLSLFKPWGLTPYGRRKQEKLTAAEGATVLKTDPGTLWRTWTLIGIISLVLLFLVLHLTRGGLRHH